MILKIKGKLVFDPIDLTKKHKSQAFWKKIAMIKFDCDINNYYAYFIDKRYNIKLNQPLRGAHVTIINDRITDKRILKNWETVKEEWNNRSIDILYEISPRTDANHWWLRVPKENNLILDDIRNEIGLGKPFYEYHLTIGMANEKNIEQSKYIHRLIKKFGNNYN